MLRVAALALGATLTIAALAPQNAAAQSGRQRSQDRQAGRVIIPQGSRTNGSVYSDGVCSDQSVYNGQRRGDDDRYERGKGHGRKDKANKHGRDNDDDDRYENDGRNQNGQYNNSYDPDCNYNRNSQSGRGPKFCQNGQGHPVYGMAWCRQKGFGDASMRNTGWEDVILRRPRYDARGDLSSSILQQVLGRSVYNRFAQQAYRLGVNAPLEGRWLDMTNGSVLNLFAGGLQIAEILDRNNDGRADVVRMNYGR